MMRAMRVDKMTLAGLAATLRLYRNIDEAEEKVPLLAMLSTTMDSLRSRAERMLPRLQALAHFESVETVEAQSMLGGGSIPTQSVPTICLQLKPKSISVQQLSDQIRKSESPIFGRIQNDAYYLDLRTILPSQDLKVIEAISSF